MPHSKVRGLEMSLEEKEEKKEPIEEVFVAPEEIPSEEPLEEEEKPIEEKPLEEEKREEPAEERPAEKKPWWKFW